MSAMKAQLVVLFLLVLGVAIGIAAMPSTGQTDQSKDWTDTGVGCVDDCLEVGGTDGIQDEADEAISKGRN